MTKLTRHELLEGLAQFGYELNQPMHNYKGEDVLLNLLKENDSRLLEGFPVAYESILNKQKHLEWENPKWNFAKTLSGEEHTKLLNLLLLTYLLFKLYGEDKSKLMSTENVLSKLSSRWKDSLKSVEERFSHSDSVKLSDKVELSTERLKNQYRNYVVHATHKETDALKLSMELEFLLSQFFSPKQKEVLKKRLTGEELSKTEKEYFYRVVNKRLKALANTNLHQFVASAVNSKTL